MVTICQKRGRKETTIRSRDGKIMTLEYFKDSLSLSLSLPPSLSLRILSLLILEREREKLSLFFSFHHQSKADLLEERSHEVSMEVKWSRFVPCHEYTISILLFLPPPPLSLSLSLSPSLSPSLSSFYSESGENKIHSMNEQTERERERGEENDELESRKKKRIHCFRLCIKSLF